MPALASAPKFRFGGHQTFPLRIAWMPKAAGEILAGNDVLSDIDNGILNLGLGKNMVEALRCWMASYQIATNEDVGWQLTPMGNRLFAENGLDPYLDDPATPWVLHWLIATNRQAPFFAWECMFNRWSSEEFTASQVIEAFKKETATYPKSPTEVSLKQHFDVFLHTYRPAKSEKGEDSLDSALAVLQLIVPSGERPAPNGGWETIFTFNSSPKTGLSQQMFAYFLQDWWMNEFPDEKSVPFRDVYNSDYSPGRILKMSEREIADRLTDLVQWQPHRFQVIDSMNLRQIHRLKVDPGHKDLANAYKSPRFIAL